MSQAPTGYEPLNTLKPVARDIWLIDGPAVRYYGLPYSTRASVVRLDNGDLWVHSPTQLTDDLRDELKVHGPVRHLIAPNQLHYTHLTEWQVAYPDAVTWAPPGVVERAAQKGLNLNIDHALGAPAETPWDGQIDQMIVEPSKTHREAVFCHRVSDTLIVTDLIQSFETAKVPARMRPYVWITGVDDSDGKMPAHIRWRIKKKDVLVDCIDRMIKWRPRRIILAHGRWYTNNAVFELERAFRRIVSDRRWDEVSKKMDREKERENARDR